MIISFHFSFGNHFIHLISFARESEQTNGTSLSISLYVLFVVASKGEQKSSRVKSDGEDRSCRSYLGHLFSRLNARYVHHQIFWCRSQQTPVVTETDSASWPFQSEIEKWNWIIQPSRTFMIKNE